MYQYALLEILTPERALWMVSYALKIVSQKKLVLIWLVQMYVFLDRILML